MLEQRHNRSPRNPSPSKIKITLRYFFLHFSYAGLHAYFDVHDRLVDEGTLSIPVARGQRHHLYDGDTLFNDIAVWILESQPRLTPTIQPVDLPDEGSGPDITNDMGIVSGWGTTSEGEYKESKNNEPSNCRLLVIVINRKFINKY